MQCTQCGSEMWDNREKKQAGQMNPKAPDYKCKDPNCAAVIWPPRTRGSFQAKPPVPQSSGLVKISADREDTIIRQHSQDMMLKELQIRTALKEVDTFPDEGWLESRINWYVANAKNEKTNGGPLPPDPGESEEYPNEN